MQLDFFAKLADRVKRALDLPARRIEQTDRRAARADSAARVPQTRSIPPSAAALQETARNLLRAIGHGELADRVQVRWNPRMRSTAGTAYPAKALITLNSRLPTFGAEEIDRTLRHELAHLLAHHRAGRRRIAPHGAEWQKACSDLGIHDEKRCHDLPLPKRHVARAVRVSLSALRRGNPAHPAPAWKVRLPRMLPPASTRAGIMKNSGL